MPDLAKYITTPAFSKLAGSAFYIKLKQESLATKTDVNAVLQSAN